MNQQDSPVPRAHSYKVYSTRGVGEDLLRLKDGINLNLRNVSQLD